MMAPRIFVGIVAACTLLAGCGDASRAPTNVAANDAAAGRPQAVETPAQAIERLEREWAGAHVRKDLGWYDRYVAADYRSVLADGRIASRADIVEHLRSSAPGQAVKVEQVDVRVYGDTAVATVTQSFNTASGKAGRSRITDVWVKSGSRWMVRHSHEGPLRR
jgi:ketosteroid isomerase-like protein